MKVGTSSPFGSRTRTLVLILLHLLGESYPREMARLTETSLSVVQAALRSLEGAGLVAGRLAGRTRLYRLNPRYFALADLQPYLARLAEPESELLERVESLRRRPRRTGKPLS